jgi:hypothetical protein
MKTVTLGCQIGWKSVGPVPVSTVMGGVTASLVGASAKADPFAIARQGAIRFAGSTRPNIFYGVGNYKGVWAVTWARTYGVATIRFSNAPDTIKMLTSATWKDRWPELYRSLGYHENYHAFMPYSGEAGAPVWTPAMVAAFQRQWGKPVKAIRPLRRPTIPGADEPSLETGEYRVSVVTHEEMEALLSRES